MTKTTRARLLLLITVALPMVWLLISPQGRLFTDLVVLRLLGKPAIEFAWDDLARPLAENALPTHYPDLRFDCRDWNSAFGERICAAEVGAFNGVPSRYMTVFFHAGVITAYKFGYQPAYYDHLVDTLDRATGLRAQPADNGVRTWVEDHGIYNLATTQYGDAADAALLWIVSGD